MKWQRIEDLKKYHQNKDMLQFLTPIQQNLTKYASMKYLIIRGEDGPADRATIWFQTANQLGTLHFYKKKSQFTHAIEQD